MVNLERKVDSLLLHMDAPQVKFTSTKVKEDAKPKGAKHKPATEKGAKKDDAKKKGNKARGTTHKKPTAQTKK